MHKAKSKIFSPKRASFKAKIQETLNKRIYILLLIPLFIISYPLIKPGISIGGDFPSTDTPDYAVNKLWLWTEKGSFPNFEILSRFPMIGLWYIVSFISIHSDLVSKFMVVLGFAAASFSFYFSFTLLFKNKMNDHVTILKVAAILGALFYAYNVWSFHRIAHWYLWIGYAMLPLFLTSILFSFNNPKNWKYILSSVLLWSFASATPHMIVFYGIIFIGTFFAFILNGLFNNKKANRKTIIQLGIPLLSIVFLYVLVNAYWLYPYILASHTQRIAPDYLLVQEDFQLLSRDSNLLNVFRLMANWSEPGIDKPSHDSSLYALWLAASFIIPLFGFSVLISRKLTKNRLIFSSLALIGVYLSLGSKAPFEYFNIFLNNPALANYAWIFRDPDKWSFLIALSYSFLIGIASYKVLRFILKIRNNIIKNSLIGCFIFFFITCIGIYSYPASRVALEQRVNPIILPSELDRLNQYLTRINTDKVFFIPYPLGETQWNKMNRVGSIYQMHSIKPSIEIANVAAGNYYRYLVDSIMQNTSKNVGNLIYPIGTSYIIFHNDTWDKTRDQSNVDNIDLLKRLYLSDGLKNIRNIGFYKVFRVYNTNSTDIVGKQINIFSQNMANLGGLQTLNMLNVLQSFNSQNSSIYFPDNPQARDAALPLKALDTLVVKRPSSTDLELSFVNDKYTTKPFDAVNSYEPTNMWSKSGTMTVPFHDYLKNIGIENRDFDYGKGIVVTQAMGTKLTIPVEIGRNGNYDVFIRYLENQKGGIIREYIDGKLISELNTLDYKSNNFIWQRISNSSSSLYLTKGKHMLTLENVAGFNAVNLFAFVPTEEMNRMKATANALANKTRNVYLLEAESNFYNGRGQQNGTVVHYLFGTNPDDYMSNNTKKGINSNNTSSSSSSNISSKTFTGQFEVPAGKDLVSVQLLSSRSTSNSIDDNSRNLIKSLEILPTNKKYNIYKSDFERNSIPLAILRQQTWLNHDKDIVSTTFETKNDVPGYGRLRVDIKPSISTSWGTISTDFIPVTDNTYYNYRMDVSAKDVNQLHSRVLYFDSQKKQISWNFVFEGKDGSFENTYTSSILPPDGAKYMRLETLAKANSLKRSTYWIDNVQVQGYIPYASFKNHLGSFEDANQPNPKLITANNSFSNPIIGLEKGNMTSYNVIQTKPYPVRQNTLYKYTMTVDTEKNVSSLKAFASFSSSHDVVENSNKYGANASNGAVLSLSRGSEVYTNLDVLKSSNYTVALRAKTCETCTFLRVSIIGEDENNNDNNIIKTSNISLKDNNDNSSNRLKWLYMNNTYLKQGKYEIRIYSDSQADLDSAIIYSTTTTTSDYSNNNGGNILLHSTKKHNNENLEDIFSSKGMSMPAHIAEYKKINPTKYIVNIKNATKPFVMSFAESYDPLWIAYSTDRTTTTTTTTTSSNNNNKDNFKTNSFPLYSIVNGFYINKTGNYTLTIEYEPQKWFVEGGAVSIATLISVPLAAVILSMIHKRRKSENKSLVDPRV